MQLMVAVATAEAQLVCDQSKGNIREAACISGCIIIATRCLQASGGYGARRTIDSTGVAAEAQLVLRDAYMPVTNYCTALSAGQHWVYGAQLTVADATAEAQLVLWDATGQIFGGLAPRDLSLPESGAAVAALQRCLAALQNETQEPR